MKKITSKTSYPDENKAPAEDSTSYPVAKDIYSNERKAGEINPEHVSQLKETREAGIEENSIDYKTGKVLDVPGSGLDEEHVAIGSENEENNYHDLGGES
jgi:kynureninase